MVFRHGCLCWRDVKTGSVAIGVFSMTVAMVQIFVQIAIWSSTPDAEDLITHPPYLVYIPLAVMDFLIFIFAIIMLVGLERDSRGRRLLLPWLMVAVIYILYETCINVYFFSEYFPWAIDVNEGRAIQDKVFPLPLGTNYLGELIVLVLYWGFKLILMILGILCVYSRYRELHYCNDPSHRPLTHHCEVPEHHHNYAPWYTKSSQMPWPAYDYDDRPMYRPERRVYDSYSPERPITSAKPYVIREVLPPERHSTAVRPYVYAPAKYY